MRITIKFSYILLIVIGFFYTCKKVDYTADINLLKSQITQINARLDSLTNAIKLVSTQLTNLETSIKSKVDNTNNRIDSISNAFAVYKASTSKSISDITSSIGTLTSDIKTINTLVTKNNTDINKKTDSIVMRIDSSFKNIKVIDSVLKVNGTNTDSLASKTIVLNKNYNDILSNYLELLKILKTANSIYLITGKIEKGPFSKGSIISFYELDSNLAQNGKSFSTTIDDNEGNYDLKASGIGGKMLRVQTDGFYYNEILNTLSNSRIVLTGISKVDSNENVNVNILTHLERRRVQYLIVENKISFDSAKRIAITELLNVFGLKNDTISRAEKVSLFRNKNDLLLNLSLMMQGYRTDAQLSELLTDISNDFYFDGKLNDTSVLKNIYNHTMIIDTANVSKNLKSKFNYNPASYSIISNYITKNSSLYDVSFSPIIYPDSIKGNKNILKRVSSDTVEAGSNLLNWQYIGFENKGIPNFEFKLTIVSDALPNTNNTQINYWNIDNTNITWTIENTFQWDNYGNQSLYATNSGPGVRIQFKPGKYYLKFYEPSTFTSPTFTKILIVR